MAADFEALPIPSKTIPELTDLAPADAADSDLFIVHDASTAAERKFSFSSLKNYLTLFFVGLFTRNVASIAELSTVSNFFAGRVVNVSSYYASSPGVGGGKFIEMVGVVTPDGGSKIASATAGRYWLRQNAEKTPYEFGYLDGDADVSVAANACTAAYGVCKFIKSVVYDAQYTIYARKLICEGGKATINCTSPTANTRFGTTGAAILCSPNPLFGDTTLTGLLDGVDIQNIIVDCNWLINATGGATPQSNSLKGIMNYRNDSFYVRGCEVYDCGSYAYWAVDDSTTGTLFCTGKYLDCYAKDFGVGFEYVNTRGIVLENCHGYISGVLPIYPEAIFHGYGGTDLAVTHNNCTGISDGPVNAIFLGLLGCKNVSFNNSKLINRYNNGATLQAAVILDPSGTSDFDDVNFNNCILYSEYTAAVKLSIGSVGSVNNSFNITDSEINGFGAALEFGGINGGRYSLTATEVIARASGVTTPIAIYASNVPLSVQVVGGLAKASTTGSGVPTVTTLSNSIFNGTNLDPAGTQPPRVRQRVVGRAEIGGDGATYATLQTFFPGAVVGWTSASVGTQKVTAVLTIDSRHPGPIAGWAGSASFAGDAAVIYGYNYHMPSNTQVRFMMPTAARGKICTYEITEWE
jgi:hypothetical protein